MKITYLKICLILTGLFYGAGAFAHGDHSQITPGHGIEHIIWYGTAIAVVLLAGRLGRKWFKARIDR